MNAKNTLRTFLTIVFVLGTLMANAQTKIYVHKKDGTAVEFNIADLDSISFTAPFTATTKEAFSGYVQKGPYLNGSSVNIIQLDKQLNQTGNVFSTTIIDNSGNFEQKNINFTSKFVELKADGYYFNEVKGENSTGPLTLYALADISDFNSVNINILTHLERQRLTYLIQNNELSFSDAKKQARSEMLNIFKFTLPDGVASESLDIANDALLLAVSVIIQGQLSTSDVSELLANISSDIRTDGRLDNPILGSQLMNNAAYLDCDQIIYNMQKKYSGLGVVVNVTGNELKSYIEQFMNNCGFKQTLGITYPETGKYGPNILADGVVMVKKTEWGIYEYSVRAELPAGNSSLKIVIKSDGAYEWGGYYPSSVENWLISSYDNNLKSNTFTVYENEKPADVTVTFSNNCTIEYYENGATTPTKVKKLYIGGDTAEDDEHEREMLIAFYQSTNGDNWTRNDNWCSDKPISLWYGIETYYHAASAKNRVLSIKLPNNNLTGSAYLADIKSLYDLNILSGNKIESLSIDNCGNEMPNDDLNNYHLSFYYDNNYSPCSLKILKISNTNGYICVNGNLSAESVIISNCNLSAQEYMYFDLPSTKIGTLTVSDCTMGYFFADNSIIGNITIDNCTFSGSNAHIYVGNKTLVNNCTGLRYIYSSRACSDLTVTNTVCNDVRCGNQ